MNILLIEDDARIAKFIAEGLQDEGWTVAHADDGKEGKRLVGNDSFDVIVLDLRLPDIDGLRICRNLRSENNQTPILMLTALGGLQDRVAGLKAGADDYLVKPFAFAELVARIEAISRRYANYAVQSNRITLGDLQFDRNMLRVTRAGKEIAMTAKELKLLEFLIDNRNRVVSRSEILAAVWEQTEDPLTNVVDVYIRRLRQKLDDGFDQALIQTVRGIGYRLLDHAAGTGIS